MPRRGRGHWWPFRKGPGLVSWPSMGCLSVQMLGAGFVLRLGDTAVWLLVGNWGAEGGSGGCTWLYAGTAWICQLACYGACRDGGGAGR